MLNRIHYLLLTCNNTSCMPHSSIATTHVTDSSMNINLNGIQCCNDLFDQMPQYISFNSHQSDSMLWLVSSPRSIATNAWLANMTFEVALQLCLNLLTSSVTQATNERRPLSYSRDFRTAISFHISVATPTRMDPWRWTNVSMWSMIVWVLRVIRLGKFVNLWVLIISISVVVSFRHFVWLVRACFVSCYKHDRERG